MSALSDAVREAGRKRCAAIEERLILAAGTGKDLAVIETWDGLTMTLRFEMVEPGGPYPTGSTVYRISLLETGHA